MNSDIFINEWIRRSERKDGQDLIDIGDKFISLWIAFNAWQKDKFGETDNDAKLIKKVVDFKPMEEIFSKFKQNNIELAQLEEYRIINMKFPDDQLKVSNYDGSFESLIKSLYAIRCNLFHGRKNFDDNETDKKLVQLAYQILNPLFKKYLKDKENFFIN